MPQGGPVVDEDLLLDTASRAGSRRARSARRAPRAGPAGGSPRTDPAGARAGRGDGHGALLGRIVPSVVSGVVVASSMGATRASTGRIASERPQKHLERLRRVAPWPTTRTACATSPSSPACRRRRSTGCSTAAPGPALARCGPSSRPCSTSTASRPSCGSAARTLLLDVVMQAPARFSSAVRQALEAELPAARPAAVRARFHLRENADVDAAVAVLDAVGTRGRTSPRRRAQGPDDPAVAAAARRLSRAGHPRRHARDRRARQRAGGLRRPGQRRGRRHRGIPRLAGGSGPAPATCCSP